MELLTKNVVVCEDNETRADLYALWLDDCDVEVALTEDQARSLLDESVAVAVLDRAFADGAAPAVLERIRAAVPTCRVLATADRATVFQGVDPDHQLAKPVFEAELQDLTERLVYRANYHHALRLYYQTTSNLVYLEVNDAPESEGERHERLRERADRLQGLIGALNGVLTDDDRAAVRDAVTFDGEFAESDSTEKIDSKYRPDRCSQCGEEWGDEASRHSEKVTQLGANIWRCGACGHVQMKTDPSHRGIGSYRR